MQWCVTAKISNDCSIHAIVNAFLIINRLPFLSDIPSQKTRNWVRHILYTSNVENAKFEASEKQQWEPLSISFSFWEKENCQVKFDLQHLAQCVSDFTVDNKSKWSMCNVTTCTGDKRDEEQILCVTGRRWFHKNCLPGEVGDQSLGTYFKCTTSSGETDGGPGGRPPPLAGHFEVFGPPVTTL